MIMKEIEIIINFLFFKCEWWCEDDNDVNDDDHDVHDDYYDDNDVDHHGSDCLKMMLNFYIKIVMMIM
jgi:hypothetical protein